MKKNKNNEIRKSAKPIKIQANSWEPIVGIEGLDINPNISTHHADIIHALFSSEGLALISFFSRTPGRNVEECRISFTHALAKRIVDLFCQHLDYYPEKPTSK
jgi:hypothetical protein